MSDGRMDTLRGPALITGVALMVMTVAVAVGNDWAIGPLVVAGDAEATMRNIAAAETRFRVGILSWSVVFIADLVAAYGFYLFLKPVDDKLALLMGWARLMYVAMLGTAIDNLVDVPLLAADAVNLQAMDQAGTAAALMRSLTAFDQTWSLGLLAFGVHVLVMSVLILRSSYVPRLFGYVLLLAAAGYFVTPVTGLLMPEREDFNRMLGMVFIGPMLGEVALGVWLLFKGGRAPSREEPSDP